MCLYMTAMAPMSTYQRQQEPNSLINQVSHVLKDRLFKGKVFLVRAVQELEAWLLIDCLGVFCSFARKVTQYNSNTRDRILSNSTFVRLIRKFQKGDTQTIVESVIGGNGAKEYLVRFSTKILQSINPNIPLRNLNRGRYRENMSPVLAEHVHIDHITLGRNDSLRELGSLLAEIKMIHRS